MSPVCGATNHQLNIRDECTAPQETPSLAAQLLSLPPTNRQNDASMCAKKCKFVCLLLIILEDSRLLTRLCRVYWADSGRIGSSVASDDVHSQLWAGSDSRAMLAALFIQIVAGIQTAHRDMSSRLPMITFRCAVPNR